MNVTLLPVPNKVSDPHHVNADAAADPDSSFYFMWKWIRIHIRLKASKLWKNTHFPYTLACHLQIDADPDPGPAYHFDADPDLAYQVDADPYPAFQFVRIHIHNTDTDVGSYCTENRIFFSAMKCINCLRVVRTFFKGTVRPDWICMRVVSLESPLKGHQPLYVFEFLFLILNI